MSLRLATSLPQSVNTTSNYLAGNKGDGPRPAYPPEALVGGSVLQNKERGERKRAPGRASVVVSSFWQGAFCTPLAQAGDCRQAPRRCRRSEKHSASEAKKIKWPQHGPSRRRALRAEATRPQRGPLQVRAKCCRNAQGKELVRNIFSAGRGGAAAPRVRNSEVLEFICDTVPPPGLEPGSQRRLS